eukprot:scaffold18636_cov112-Isochrysis_galbana.AAC.3
MLTCSCRYRGCALVSVASVSFLLKLRTVNFIGAHRRHGNSWLSPLPSASPPFRALLVRAMSEIEPETKEVCRALVQTVASI